MWGGCWFHRGPRKAKAGNSKSLGTGDAWCWDHRGMQSQPRVETGLYWVSQKCGNNWAQTTNLFPRSEKNPIWLSCANVRNMVVVMVIVIIVAAVQSLNPVQLFCNYSPLGSSSIGFSKQEYWSGLSFPSPGDLPDPWIEPNAFHLLHRRQIFYHCTTGEAPTPPVPNNPYRG